MNYLSNFERQHAEIKESVNYIGGFIRKKDFSDNLDEIAKEINVLAGKLKIHLDTEDKFLYPGLRESQNQEIRKLSEKFMNEMGDIHKTFVNYKTRFNTKNKIASDIDEFVKSSKEVFKVLEMRMSKEDAELYPLIKG